MLDARALARFSLVFAVFIGCSVAACESSGGGRDPDSAPPDACADTCNELAGQNCGDVGQSCFSVCTSWPNAAYPEPCAAERRAYAACFWEAPSYGCAAEKTRAEGCDDEEGAFNACLMGSLAEAGAGSGGAAGQSDARGGGGAPDRD